MKIKPVNPIAKDLGQSKYRQRIVEDKRRKLKTKSDKQEVFDEEIRRRIDVSKDKS